MSNASRIAALLAAFALSGCGGGGGGGSGSAGGGPTPSPAATATLSASFTTVVKGEAVTLTWSSNQPTCIATNGWGGNKPSSGTETTAPLATTTTFSLSCGTATASVNVTVVAPTVGGRLLVSSTTRTDSDTNDLLRTPIFNGYWDNAQALPNPVAVGGFAGAQGAITEGAFKDKEDTNDIYRVSITAGQLVELAVATPDEGDLDLHIYDLNQVYVTGSAGVSVYERVTIQKSGEYFVRVLAAEGASNYTLMISQPAPGATSSNWSLDRDFVPGELLANFKQHSGESHQKLQVRRDQLMKSQQLQPVYEEPGTGYAVLRVAAAGSRAAQKMRLKQDAVLFGGDVLERKLDTLYAIKELYRSGAVEWAQPNFRVEAHALPNDEFYAQQRWHYELIGLPAAWEVTTGSSNVVVAVIDGGVRRHTELAPRLVDGYDFVSRPEISADGDGRDADYSDPGVPDPQGSSYTFHGTHVAGTVGAMGNNTVGVTGVAWNVQIMPLRALGVSGSRGTGDIADVLEALKYAARLPNASGFVPGKRADVVNMSLGSNDECSPAYSSVINQVRQAGIIVVASAGNDALPQSGAPGSCPGVISVSAINQNSQPAGYSNYGANVDVAAPGGDSLGRVFSTHSKKASEATYYNEYKGLQGTSMAAPHVAGVIALMKSVNPTLTPAMVDTLLASGALTDDIGPAGPDQMGIGRINALKAVNAAASDTAPSRPGQLAVNPSSLSFVELSNTATVQVSNAGTASVSVTQVMSSATWLTVAPAQVGATGMGSYTVTVNRAGLAAGTYSGSIEFRASVGQTARVQVLLQVLAAGAKPDGGQHYLLLVDPETGNTIEQVNVDANDAAVSFKFPSVGKGEYYLVVGTDADWDGIICDEGEACGEYPLLNEAQLLKVTNANLEGLDVPTGYTVAITQQSQSALGEKQARKGYKRLR